MKQCKLISIDSSTKKTAMAVFVNGKYKKVDLIDLIKIKMMDNRFEEMARKIYQYLEKEKPWVVYVEETVVSRDAQTQRFLTRLQGVIYTYCLFHDCEFNTIRPTEWRKLVGIKQGKGTKRADLKKASIDLVKKLYQLDVGDDEADAILIGEAVLNKFDGPEAA